MHGAQVPEFMAFKSAVFSAARAAHLTSQPASLAGPQVRFGRAPRLRARCGRRQVSGVCCLPICEDCPGTVPSRSPEKRSRRNGCRGCRSRFLRWRWLSLTSSPQNAILHRRGCDWTILLRLTLLHLSALSSIIASVRLLPVLHFAFRSQKVRFLPGNLAGGCGSCCPLRDQRRVVLHLHL